MNKSKSYAHSSMRPFADSLRANSKACRARISAEMKWPSHPGNLPSLATPELGSNCSGRLAPPKLGSNCSERRAPRNWVRIVQGASQPRNWVRIVQGASHPGIGFELFRAPRTPELGSNCSGRPAPQNWVQIVRQAKSVIKHDAAQYDENGPFRYTQC